MDLLNGNVKKLFFSYLFAAFGSALISSIYGLVDMAVVGQYEGPSGTAALAIVAPIWNIIYSLGLLMGVGGSVLLSTLKGQNKDTKERNQFFTIALIGSIIFSFISTLILNIFEGEILRFFGANDEAILSLAKGYLKPIKYVFPCFLFNQMLAAFLRNDNDPLLATIAIVGGGIFNIFGDIFFTFTLNMGIFGAGLATAIGSVISLITLLSHFLKKKNTLTIVKIANFFPKIKDVIFVGFPVFFVDVAMGIVTLLFNRQISIYLNNDALSVYGIIINISTFVQCCSYSVGQAAQPIISINLGAKKYDRIKKTLLCALITSFVFSIFWTSLSMIAPNIYVYIFMSDNSSILEIAPKIIRLYSLSFIFLPLNVFSTYFFQAIKKIRISLLISVFRGLLLSSLLILVLPLINNDALWLAMPLNELLIAIIVIVLIIYYDKKVLSTNSENCSYNKLTLNNKSFD